MRASEPLKYLVKEMNGKLQVIFKHYPLPSHKNAEVAARGANDLISKKEKFQNHFFLLASLAAAKQGLFWEYHDHLWNNMRHLSESQLKKYAKIVGCDMNKWEEDFNSKQVKDQVEYERDLAVKIGVKGTPAFVVGGKVSTGWG